MNAFGWLEGYVPHDPVYGVIAFIGICVIAIIVACRW